MSAQKERWSARAERRLSWAASLEAKADALEQNRTRDWAFMSQPGHIPARARENARSERAHELRKQAEAHRAKAAELERLASTNKGDAERTRQAARDAFAFAVGERALSVFYGEVEVVRINAKTCRVRTLSGWETAHDKAHLRALRRAAA